MLSFVAAPLLIAAVACGTANPSAETSSDSTAAGVDPPVARTIPSPATVGAATPRLPATVNDKDGRPVTIGDVSRILALNGEITEIVFALGLGDNVVGIDTSATYPPQVKALPNVGYQRALAAEGILALRPSVIIGNENAGPPAVIEQIRGAGVPVLIIKYSPAVESVPDKIRAVAEALGVTERGDEIARATQREIDDARALAARATTRPKVAYLNVRGGGTQQIWGEGTSGAAMIAAAGGVDAGTQAGIKGSKPLTAEAIVTMQPDVLLVLTASLESVGGVDGLLQIPGIAQTPAGRNKRVLQYEDQYLLGMGPRTGQALLDLVQALHPELR